jgi:hypothetical protein
MLRRGGARRVVFVVHGGQKPISGTAYAPERAKRATPQ